MYKAKLIFIFVLLSSCGSPWDLENMQGSILFEGGSYIITPSKDNANSYMVQDSNSSGGLVRQIDPQVHVGNIKALEFYTGCDVIPSSVTHTIGPISYAVVDC